MKKPRRSRRPRMLTLAKRKALLIDAIQRTPSIALIERMENLMIEHVVRVLSEDDDGDEIDEAATP